MARHECPDCGHVHELKAEERIKRLEKRVHELEANPCSHPHWYWTYYPTYPHYTIYPNYTNPIINGTTWTNTTSGTTLSLT